MRALNIAVLPFGFCGTWASAERLLRRGSGLFRQLGQLTYRRVLFVFQLARANDFLIFGLHSIFINLIFDISHLRKMQGGEKLCLKKPKSGMKKKTLMKKIGKRKQKKNRTVFFCASNTFSIRQVSCRT